MATGLMGRQERRRAPRATEGIPIAISEDGADLRAESKNLSDAGVYCTLARFIPPMSKLALSIELPGRQRPQRIRCTGVVVRVEPVVIDGSTMRYNTALFFTEISDRQRAAIARFVRGRLAPVRPSTRA